MKYRFSTLDQILQSPLFDFSSYNKPHYAGRSTAPLRLETQILEDIYSNAPNEEMLSDVFHLLYADTHRFVSMENRDPYARLLRYPVLDNLMNHESFNKLRQLCMGNANISLEAAKTYLKFIEDELLKLYSTAGHLLDVLQKLEKRHDDACEELHRLVSENHSDTNRTQDAIRAAVQTASTAEQINAVSDMIRDALRKRHEETVQSINIALQKSYEATLVSKSISSCWGDPAQDFQMNQELVRRVTDNPMLLGITRQLGRMKEMLSDLRKNAYAYGRGEKYSLTRGRDLKNLLSGELALLASPTTDPLFLRKYASGKLLQYAKREKTHKGSGDIIVCLDESNSTEGENAQWAKALALAVQDICAHENRKYALVHFSGKDEYRTDLFLPGQYTSEDILSAAEHFFNGTTDFETPLREALRIMEENSFEKADILFITDGYCDISDHLAGNLQHSIDAKQCTIIGILLDVDQPGSHFSMDELCEKVYKTSDIAKEQITETMFQTYL